MSGDASAATSYEVIGRLGDGDVAELFLARAAGAERLTVLKRIPPALTQNAELVRALVDDARVAAHLQHPNVVPIHEVAKLGGSYGFATELVNGETLRALVEHAKAKKIQIPIRSIVTIAAGAAAGLHHAHERAVVHGALSPTSVVVSRDGIVKVDDFGLARARSRLHAPIAVDKLGYWSPEQSRSEPLDRRSDLFSLGVVLWELITLEELYNRGGDARTRAAIENEPPVPPSTRRYDVPQELDAIIRRLVEKAPGERYQTADELVAALEGLASKLAFQLSTSELARMMRLWFGNIGEPVIARAETPVIVRSAPIPADVPSPAADPIDEVFETAHDASALLRAGPEASASAREGKITLVPGIADTVHETRENFEQIRDRILAQARKKKETRGHPLVGAAAAPGTAVAPAASATDTAAGSSAAATDAAAGSPAAAASSGTTPPPTTEGGRAKRGTLSPSQNPYSFITNVAGKAAEPVRRLTSTPPSGTPTTDASGSEGGPADAASATASAVIAAAAAAAKANAARLDAKAEADTLAARAESARVAAAAKSAEAARADEEARAAAASAKAMSEESARNATRAEPADASPGHGAMPGRLVVVVEEANVDAAKADAALEELERKKTTGVYDIPPDQVVRDAEALAAANESASAATRTGDVRDTTPDSGAVAAAVAAADASAAHARSDAADAGDAKNATAATDAPDTKAATAGSGADTKAASGVADAKAASGVADTKAASGVADTKAATATADTKAASVADAKAATATADANAADAATDAVDAKAAKVEEANTAAKDGKAAKDGTAGTAASSGKARREAPPASEAAAKRADASRAAAAPRAADDDEPRTSALPGWMLPAALGSAVLLVVAIVFAMSRGDERKPQASTQQAAAAADARAEPAVALDASVAVTPADAAEHVAAVVADAAVTVAPADAALAAVSPPDAAAVASTDKPKDPTTTDKPKDPTTTDKPKDPTTTDKSKDPTTTDKPKDPATTDKPKDPAMTTDKPKEPEASKSIEDLVAGGDFAGANKACKTNTIFNSARLTACTLAACNVKDVALARRWIRAISKAARPDLIKTCRTLGVELEEAPPVPSSPVPSTP